MQYAMDRTDGQTDGQTKLEIKHAHPISRARKVVNPFLLQLAFSVYDMHMNVDMCTFSNPQKEPAIRYLQMHIQT